MSSATTQYRFRDIAYKHVDPKFADAFEAGTSIKLGTLAHYREMEGERADVLEGMTRNYITGNFDQNSDPVTGSRLNSLYPDMFKGLRISNCGNINLFNEALPSLIFCMSKMPDESLRKKGSVVFEITDMLRYYRALCRYLHPLVVNGDVMSIKYEDRGTDITANDPVLVDPFSKAVAFAWEREIRMCWRLANADQMKTKSAPPNSSPIVWCGPKRDHIFANCPETAEFVRRL